MRGYERFDYANLLIRDRTMQKANDSKLLAGIMGVTGMVSEKVINADPGALATMAHIGEAGIVGAIVGYGTMGAIRFRNKVFMFNAEHEGLEAEQLSALQAQLPKQDTQQQQGLVRSDKHPLTRVSEIFRSKGRQTQPTPRELSIEKQNMLTAHRDDDI